MPAHLITDADATALAQAVRWLARLHAFTGLPLDGASAQDLRAALDVLDRHGIPSDLPSADRARLEGVPCAA